MPYLAFMIPKGVKVSGIVYGIYLYRWQELSLSRKCAEVAWHFLLGKRNCFQDIFILNDAESATHFNRMFHSNHFKYLPDPFLPLPESQEDYREKFGIPPERKVFYHFGSFGKKKGTLEILKSTLKIPNSEQKNYCFVFAGCVQPSIKEEFYNLIEQVRQTDVQCLVFDEFCTYEFLAGWCQACDAVLVPYLLAYNSSGCIGYAAQCNKPVIGPVYGLLGKLIRQYGLGLQLEKITSGNLCKAYIDVQTVMINSHHYLVDNTIEKFCKTILN
ncbi:MAG: hypothetical protein BWZ05_02311 [Bacteroidetes bacterium ADurb.BinA245]|nr:MAG: hypothetical protein BWZ05_02311 [Bacteroidetes bacterium ADurb.BinA245]